MKLLVPVIVTSALALTAIGAVHAQGTTAYSQAGFYGAVGYDNVSPKSVTGELLGTFGASVSNDAEPTLTLGYRFPRGVGIEAWAPISRFQHDLRVGSVQSASFRDRPLLVTLQYHFRQEHAVQPFVGVGYGWVNVGDVRVGGPNGPIAGKGLDIEDTNGIVGQLGVDVFATPHLFVRADAKYFNWESDVQAAGTNIGKLKVNPWIYGISVGLRF